MKSNKKRVSWIWFTLCILYCTSFVIAITIPNENTTVDTHKNNSNRTVSKPSLKTGIYKGSKYIGYTDENFEFEGKHYKYFIILTLNPNDNYFYNTNGGTVRFFEIDNNRNDLENNFYYLDELNNEYSYLDNSKITGSKIYLKSRKKILIGLALEN